MFSASLPIEVSRQSVRVRALQSIHAAPMVLIVALLAAWGLLSQVPLPYLLGWIVPVCAMALLNRYICTRILAALGEPLRSRAGSRETAAEAPARPQAPNAEAADAATLRLLERELFWIGIASNVAMATGIWWISLGSSVEKLWFLVTMVQCLYTLAAMVNASSSPRTFITSAAINIVSLALFWTTQGEQGIVVGFALIGVFMLLARLTLQIRREFEQTMKMRMENKALVDSLKVEREYGNAAWAAAERGNLARSRFLAAASHDLRQPLHTLMLFAGLLETATEEERRGFVHQIQQTADTLNKMFSGLIDLSKLDAGTVQPTLMQIDVNEFMRPLVEELEANARDAHLQCRVRIEPAFVDSDPMLLERVLRNVLDNAVKYTHAGTIEVSVTQVVRDGRSFARFCVADTGIGIPSHEHDRVFEEFVQLDNPGRLEEKGTGLGLAIVKRLCALLEHPITLDSTPGSGTRVSIDVRLHSAAPASVASVPRLGELTPSLAGLRVLVIDDVVGVREAMAAQLRAWNCMPILASNMAEALASMGDHDEQPQVVIADFNLGSSQTGFDAIRALRRINPHLHCAVFTGETDAFWQHEMRDKEVPIFQKPVSAHAIRGWLQQTLAAA